MNVKNIILPEATVFHDFNYEVLLLKLNNNYMFKSDFTISYVLFSNESSIKNKNNILNIKDFYNKNKISIVDKIPSSIHIFDFNLSKNLDEIIDDFTINIIKPEYVDVVRVNFYKKLIKL